ncbi:hypothetical protein [Phenylobacterium sp.]|uniref:hypothetical protein n=1 Tax=Phenylobacterium sp. TaxID=1871053 RepID=UPI002731D2B0|nr:hypothetical protein [Phenylobacterium sp.]MDP1617485.1 hypothetical protein [Phenylobacterium sp.]MDP1986777.1 hypothetical protein [Phenylobacterium sp.]
MGVARRPQAYLVLTSAGWADSVEFYLGDIETPDNVSVMELRLMLKPPHVAAIDLSDYLSVDGHVVTWTIPEAVTETWNPGEAAIELNVRPEGDLIDRHTFLATAKIQRGL